MFGYAWIEDMVHIDQNSVSNREWQAILSAPIEDSTREDILVKLTRTHVCRWWLTRGW
jgi:hypothetical protein